MAIGSGIRLAVVLGFLHIQISFCTYFTLDDRDWKSICDGKKCVPVDLSTQKKHRVVDHTDQFGSHHEIYCIRRVNPLSVPGLRHMWYRYHVTLDPNSDKDVTVVLGNSTREIEQIMKMTDSSLWGSSRRVIGTKFGSSPFEVQCVGVRVMPDKTAKYEGNKFSLLFDKRLQPLFPLTLVCGFGLFFVAPYLTNNTQLYYSGGVALGVIASLLVLLYVFSKFVPKKNLFGLGILLGGYSFTGLFLHWVYSQGLVFVQENLFFVSCYVAVSGLISFAVLYRMGPAHERTMTLIKWFLQLIGLALMFFSMQFPPFGVVIVTAFLLWNNMPNWLSNFASSVFYWFFFCLKPRPRLIRKKMLTTEQYEEQGRTETAKALSELRGYCMNRSSKWKKKLMKGDNKLNGAAELQSFIEGGDHIPMYQRNQHETEFDSDVDSDDDTADYHSSPNSSSPGSGIPSPNPSPPRHSPSYRPQPSAPYQRPYEYDFHSPALRHHHRSPAIERFDRQRYHTTNV